MIPSDTLVNSSDNHGQSLNSKSGKFRHVKSFGRHKQIRCIAKFQVGKAKFTTLFYTESRAYFHVQIKICILFRLRISKSASLRAYATHNINHLNVHQSLSPMVIICTRRAISSGYNIFIHTN